MITVVGIGADGWGGLTDPARDALRAAPRVVGSERQLDLLPRDEVTADRTPWPSPMAPLVDELAARAATTPVAVLASGDPMLHGVGATLARAAGPEHVHAIPHPSAFALACARMGWPAHETTLVSAVARPTEAVLRHLQPGRRIVAYVTGTDGAARLAQAAANAGFGPSALTVLEQLGGPHEHRTDTTAAEATDLTADPLHCVALHVRPAAEIAPRPTTPGLPDDAFASDGQLTKRHVRAITVAALGPLPDDLLWDVGAGNGSVAVEFLRAEPLAHAIAVEPREDRAQRIAHNAHALGVPHLKTVHGSAPEALASLDRPTVVFVGGGITTPGLLDACWDALHPGGRLVANTVTLEGEQVITAAQRERGGTLTRIDVAHAEPIGGFTGWRAQMTVVQWSAVKERQ